MHLQTLTLVTCEDAMPPHVDVGLPTCARVQGDTTTFLSASS